MNKPTVPPSRDSWERLKSRLNEQHAHLEQIMERAENMEARVLMAEEEGRLALEDLQQRYDALEAEHQALQVEQLAAWHAPD